MENMSDNNRIILNYDSVDQDIEYILDEIRQIRSEKYFVEVLGQTTLQKIKDYDISIKKRLHDKFNIVVIGDFKRGKSTLINAMLGDNIVPAAVTPETVTINKISYSETPKTEAVLKNGKRATLAQTELKREVIESLMQKLPAQIDYIDIKQDIETLKDISIIDTPGVGDLLNKFDNQVAEYLVNADALIYVVSAKAPMSFSEQSFLSTSVMPQSFSRIFIVVNMADCLETEDNIKKIKDFTLDKAKNISPNIYVYTLSALDELCRKKNLKRPEPELSECLEQNFYEFENAIQNDIILQKDIIKSTRGIALTRILLNDIIARIQLLKNSLKDNVDKLLASEDEFSNQNSELMKKIKKHELALTNDIFQMKAEAKSWISEFIVKLKQEIQSLKAVASVSDLERHFQFYLMDLIKQAFLACIEHHQKEISDRLAVSSKTFANEISQTTFGNINTQISDCITDISWTNIDSAMFISGSFLGLSDAIGPLYLIGQAVAGAIRQQVVNKKQSDYLSPILQEFDMITSDILNKVDEIYDNISQKAVEKLNELYQNQIEISLDAIKQAKEIASREDLKTDEVISYLDTTQANVLSLRDLLVKYE